MAQNFPPFTVGLVVRNEAPNITHCLSSLLNQTRPELLAEIVLIDNASTDATVAVARSVLGPTATAWRIIERSSNNLGAARSEVMNLAKTDWVLMLDGDAVAPRNWLENWAAGLCRYAQENPAAISGAQIFPDHGSFYPLLNLLAQTPLGHGGSPQMKLTSDGKIVPHVPTYNALFFRPAVLAAGNFSAAFAQMCEDVELSYRLKNHGQLLAWSKSPVEHRAADHLYAWIDRMFRFGRGQWLVIRQHPRHLSTRLLFCGAFALAPGLIFLAPEAFAYLAVIYLLAMVLMSAQVSRKSGHLSRSLPLAVLLLSTHFAYSYGFLFGVFQLLKKNCPQKA